MAYVIDAEKCDHCGECLAACPMEAISVDGNGLVTIDADLCTDCGTCADLCPESAISGSP